MSNAKLLQKQLVNRATTMAAVLTRNPHVQVTISGTQAFQTPGRINIPAGDFTDPEWMIMAKGWVDHELGHEEYSLDEPYDISYSNPPVHHLLQIIEDVRMEKVASDAFRGTRTNLLNMATLMIERGLLSSASSFKQPGVNEFIFIRCLCIYKGRWEVLGHEPSKALAEDAYRVAVEVFGQQVTDDICTALDRMGSLTDTYDSLALAEEVIQILMNHQEDDDDQDDESEEDDEGNSPDSNNSDSKDSDSNDDANGNGQPGDEDDSNESEASQGADGADKQNANGQPGDDDGSNESEASQGADGADKQNANGQPGDDDGSNESEASQGAGGASSSDTAQPTPGNSSSSGNSKPTKLSAEDIAKVIDKALNIERHELPEDMHTALARLISSEANEDAKCEHVSAASEVTIVEASPLLSEKLLNKAQARKISGSIYQTLHKVIFDQVQNLPALRTRGTKLKSSKLGGVPAGNFAVFKQLTDQQDTSAAIMVLADASQSMMNNPKVMENTNTAALAFALGAEKAGISTEVVYFGQSHNAKYTAKRFDQKVVDSNFTVVGYANTPTGQVMAHAMYSLLARHEKHKLMVILTDGHPDNVDQVKLAKSNLTDTGVKIIPIGINSTSIKGFEDGEFVSVNDTNELSNAMKQAIRLGLFK